MRLKIFMTLGYGALLLSVICIGAFSTYELFKTREIVGELYEHPFTVASTVLSIKSDIIKIHSVMKDVSIHTDAFGHKMAMHIREIDRLDKNVCDKIPIIKKFFLGDKRKIDKFEKDFIAWRSIRKKEFELASNDKHAQVMEIARNKGAQQVKLLTDQIDYLYKFAQNKAAFFYGAANRDIRRKIWVNVSVSLIIFGIGVILTILPLRNILRRLGRDPQSLNEIVERVMSGDFSIKQDVVRQGVYGKMLELVDRIKSFEINSRQIEQNISNGKINNIRIDENIYPGEWATISGCTNNIIHSLRSIIDDFPIPLFIINPELNITYANKIWIDFFHSSKKDLTDTPLANNVIAENSTELIGTLSELINSSSMKTVKECVLTTGRDETRHFHLSATKISDNNDKLQYIICQLQDIETRVRAEQEVRKSRQNLLVTLNSIGDAVIATDTDGNVTSMNPVAETLTGWKENEAKGVPLDKVFVIINSITRKKVENPVVKVLETGQVIGLANHTTLVSKNGSEKHIADSAAPIIDEKGRTIGIVLIFRDVTEEYAKNLALAESREQYRSVVEDAPLFICAIKLDGEITYVNPEFARYFMKATDEITGQNMLKMVPRNHRSLVLTSINSLTPTNPVSQIEHQIIRDDAPRWIHVCHRGIFDEHGKCISLMCFGQDIDDRIRNEIALRAAKEKAEEATRAKSDFLANVSHEIRTPLNAIIGFGNLLELEDITMKQYNFVHSITTASNALLGLVNDILDLSKIEAKKLKLAPSTMDLNSTCDELEVIFAQRAMKKGIDFQIIIPVDIPPLIIDGLRLRQILSNLIDNAVKFTEKGHVHLIISHYPSEKKHQMNLQFVVRDTGIGISPERVKYVFNAFEQNDSSITRKYGGTGLGLTISRYLAELMGGNISVESTLGEGSAFIVTINNIMIADAPEPPEETPNTLNKFAPVEVLLVDDIEDNRNVLAQQLLALNLIPVESMNGLQAVEAAKNHPPALILMDIRMPMMDGCEAARKIRKLPGLKNMPIIAITASALDLNKTGYDLALFDDILSKPINIFDLSNRLADYLEATEVNIEIHPGHAIISKQNAQIDYETVKLSDDCKKYLSDKILPLLENINSGATISETCRIAEEIISLAEKIECTPVSSLGHAIFAAAESFDLNEIEKSVMTIEKLLT